MARGARRCERQRVAHRAQCFPRRLAAIRLPDSKSRRASEMQRVGTLEPCSTHDILDRRERSALPRGLEGIERLLADTMYVPPSHAQGRLLRVGGLLGGAHAPAVAHAG